MRPIPLLTISVAAVLAASAPASAVTISPTHVRFPQMAVGTHGRTVVAWERLTNGRFSVEARIGDGPLRLGRTRLLARVGYRPQVAVGADGTVAVEWAESGPRSGRDVRVRVAVARSDHGFGRVQTVERRNGNIWPVDVAVQPTGCVVAIWRRSNTRLAYALATRGHRFAAARDLTETGTMSPGMVAVDPRDGAIVLAYGTRPSIVPLANEQAAVRTLSPSAPAFSGPTVLSATRIAGEAAPIAVFGPAGAAVAFTVSGNGAGLVLVRRSADGSWAAPQTIAVTGNVTNVFARGLRATLPAGGAAIAAWSVVTEPTDPFALPLRARD